MNPYIIDLNDAGVRVARGTQELVRSPGYATLTHGKVEVGATAYAHAWMAPRHTHNRFWHELDTKPVKTLGRRIRHAGDLAYLHLVHLLEQSGRPKAAIVVVPGCYQRAQLSLLLGIAQAAGLSVSALVDSACAAGAGLMPGRYTHIEMLLHQTIISQIEVDDVKVTRRAVEVLANAGFRQVEQRIVQMIVEAFLKRCRFDPLHHAITEQALHSRLPEWLAALASRPEIAIALDYRGAHHEISLHRDLLIRALAPLLSQIQQRSGMSNVILDHRMATVPGLRESLGPAHVLAPETIFRACAENTALVAAGTGVTLLTELAVSPSEHRQHIASVSDAAPRAKNSASHILVQNGAFPLTSNPLYLAARGTVQRNPAADSAFSLVRDALGVRLDVINCAEVILNGDAVLASARVVPGDHISVTGAPTLFLPITVQADDAL